MLMSHSRFNKAVIMGECGLLQIDSSYIYPSLHRAYNLKKYTLDGTKQSHTVRTEALDEFLLLYICKNLHSHCWKEEIAKKRQSGLILVVSDASGKQNNSDRIYSQERGGITRRVSVAPHPWK